MANTDVKNSESENKAKDRKSEHCDMKLDLKDNFLKHQMHDNESNGDSSNHNVIMEASVPNHYHNGSYELDMLPDEMLDFIFSYLPPYRDLQSCSSVSKRWHGLVINLIRRRNFGLHKGLVDFHLQWQVCKQQNGCNLDNNRKGSHVDNNAQHSASPTTIAGRFLHSAVRYKNSMYIFGGGSSSDTTFNDLWRFDLSEMRWERPLSMGSYPSPKASATMVCWRDQLILYGGWRYPSLHSPYQQWRFFDELHYYNLSTNRWMFIDCMTNPPPLAGHSASVHGDIMVIFGGNKLIEGTNSTSNQTWCLNLKEPQWWQPRFQNNVKPPPRFAQFQLALDDQHLLIIGGSGGPNRIYSDAWLLDMSGEFWIWKPIEVRNKKFAASHMWCNPACKVGSKLVVLGPTPNMPQDFQLIKQTRVPIGRGTVTLSDNAVILANYLHEPNLRFYRHYIPPAIPEPAVVIRLPDNNHGHNRLQNIRLAGAAAALPRQIFHDDADDEFLALRRRILNKYLQNARNNNLTRSQHYANNNCNNNGNNTSTQPRVGSLKDLRSYHSPADNDERNYNRPSSSSSRISLTLQRSGSSNNLEARHEVHPRNDDLNQEAMNRLQRNLALRCRENDPILPKRFDELDEGRICMAAFNEPNRQYLPSKDHNERIRRMEEKMNALRNSHRMTQSMQKAVKEPVPKRIKRNVLSLFVCDLSNAIAATEPYVEWLQYKNYGVMAGAPERVVFSTMIHGNGELVLFGGVHKETLHESIHQVSNAVHFLTPPRDIV